MGFFTSTTKPVDLGGGNTVTLRKVTFGQYADAQSAATHIANDSVQLDWPRLRAEVLKRSVESWDGPDSDGQAPTAENIARLPWEIGNKLAEEAMQLATVGTEAGN
jgi:hypothetical protein